jgi:antitoxin component YwqK of YwqJK toxin-antitoxin module
VGCFFLGKVVQGDKGKPPSAEVPQGWVHPVDLKPILCNYFASVALKSLGEVHIYNYDKDFLGRVHINKPGDNVAQTAIYNKNKQCVFGSGHYEDGSVKTIMVFVNNKPIREFGFRKDGSLESETIWPPGSDEGIRKNYSPDGTISGTNIVINRPGARRGGK